MSTTTVTDYNAKRAELLAQLVLTRRKGVQLFPFPKNSTGEGTDLIVIFNSRLINIPQFISQCDFVARVKGIDKVLEDEREASAYCSKHWKSMYAEGFLFAPAVFLLFSVEGDRGYFSWVLEPQVDREKGPILTRIESPSMRKIDKKSIEDVFDRVEEWHKAMVSGHLLRA